MKKKNLKLRKLTLKKSNVATLAQRGQIMGGSNGPGCNSDIECTLTCAQDTCTSVPQPNPSDNCNTQFPNCQFSQGFSCGPACNPTEMNCVTQQSCDPGGFLCTAGSF